MVKIDDIIMGILFHECDNANVVVDELYVNNLNVEPVIRI